jgi:hypothetical protein
MGNFTLLHSYANEIFMPYEQVTSFTECQELKDSTRFQIVMNINNSEVEHKDVASLLTNLYILCEHDTIHLLVKNLTFRNLFL